MQSEKTIIVIVGPTATGKSDLAVRLAKKWNGEIISADSRQVYRELNIGTGKVTKREMAGIPHHLLNVASPKRRFTVIQYKRLARKAIRNILQHNKIPIIVGGTGFYIQSVIDGIVLPEVAPDAMLRKKLAQVPTHVLYDMLLQLDQHRAATIDRHNPRRLVRAIEIAHALGKVPDRENDPLPHTILQIGIDLPDTILKQKIHTRLTTRLRRGMLSEAKRLHTTGLSWKRMEELGLEYRYMARYLQGTISKEEMIDQLSAEIWHYAKRQRTWFKKDKRITWFSPDDYSAIGKYIQSKM